MKKKGDINYLVIMIATLATILVLIIFAKQLADFFSSAGSTSACETTVLKASFLEGVSFGAIQSTLKCNNLPDTTISKSSVVASNKINDDAVKKTIANSMLECWKTTGRGKIDPYNSYEGDQTYCFICSDVIFDKDFVQLAKDSDYQLNGMLKWLGSNNAPDVKDSYYKVMFGSDLTLNQTYNEPPLDISQQYTILWRMETSKLTGLQAGGIIAGGTASVALVGTLAGVILAPVIVPIVGATTVGAVIAGTVLGTAGAGAGLIGSAVLVKKSTENSIVTSQILVVPKKILAQQIEKDGKQIPFCTKLVNY